MIYLKSFMTAIALFPGLAAFLTLPYTVVQYHRFGAVSKLKTLFVFLFILYLEAAYFQVILPLPGYEKTIGNTLQDHLRLIPYQSVFTFFIRHAGARHLIRKFLFSSSLMELTLNVLLTVPFGAFLAYFFKLSFRKTALCSFLLSLFFEFTQLSALYGLYAGPYRTCDVTDLINNTLGGILGYHLAYMLMHYLPDRNSFDRDSYEISKVVSGKRRFWAVLTDLVLFTPVFLFVYYFVLEQWQAPESNILITMAVYHSFFLLYCWLSMVISGGYTAGRILCRIRLVSADDTVVREKQLALRYLLLYAFLVLPTILALLLGAEEVESVEQIVYSGNRITASILMLIPLLYRIYYFIHVFCRRGYHSLLHDRVSQSKYVSTYRKL